MLDDKFPKEPANKQWAQARAGQMDHISLPQ
jgi:hypothetical protein